MKKRSKTAYFQNPQLNGNNYHYAGRKNSILLFHGFTATTVEVKDLAVYFASYKYTVTAPLLPGHGTSPDDLNATKYSEWIDCAIKNYKYLSKNSDSIVIGGESMGALLAIHLASCYENIRAVLLYSPALLVNKNSYAQFLKFFIKYYHKRKSSNNLPWQGYTVYPLAAAEELKKLQDLVDSNLTQITQPTIIFQGNYDQTIDTNNGEYIYQTISSQIKELVYMENSGHVMLLDQEKENIFQLSMNFLESNKIL